ncbi:methyltransferase [Halococcus agarilyticus]|uniref:methyltransferase n=1 Tax=Halococcus agarilyticus TaxID=1232219 RepID=UPI0006778039|nr:methyltransferase [Halococcus agarilyticus]
MNRSTDELALESRVSGARPEYRFATADGVCSERSFRTAELLLVESLWDADPGRLLVPEANYGVVGTVLAARASSAHLTESSARAARLCERNARRNDADVEISTVADLTTLGGTFETVAYAPKPYTPLAVGTQRIADALSVLGPGDELFLAAAPRTGLARYETHLDEMAAGVERRATRGDWRLLVATRPDSFDPPTYVSPRTIRPEIDGATLELVTVPGLFSPTALDDGTRLLLETATVEDGERVLDPCCGYGAIGAYAGLAADCEVWLTDDDRVATACAERSLRASGVDAIVVTADCTAGVADRTFDRVLCNPPTHASDGVLAELFAGIADVLARGGELTTVHHRDLDLRNHLSEFDRIETRRTGAEHVVLSAIK